MYKSNEAVTIQIDKKNGSEKVLSASQLLRVHAEATKSVPATFEKKNPQLGRGLQPGAFINLSSDSKRSAAKVIEFRL